MLIQNMNTKCLQNSLYLTQATLCSGKKQFEHACDRLAPG